MYVTTKKVLITNWKIKHVLFVSKCKTFLTGGLTKVETKSQLTCKEKAKKSIETDQVEIDLGKKRNWTCPNEVYFSSFKKSYLTTTIMLNLLSPLLKNC